jgi:hypothetical protein
MQRSPRYSINESPVNPTGYPISGCAWVYVIGERGPRPQYVKVGLTGNVWKRLDQLARHSPRVLVVEYVVGPVRREIAAKIERQTHEILHPKSVDHEWFGCSPLEAGFALEAARASIKMKLSDSDLAGYPERCVTNDEMMAEVFGNG